MPDKNELAESLPEQEREKLISDHEKLLDTIFHDIKGPLANMLLAVELIKNIPEEDLTQFHSIFKIIKNSISKLDHVITGLTGARNQEHTYNAKERR